VYVVTKTGVTLLQLCGLGERSSKVKYTEGLAATNV